MLEPIRMLSSIAGNQQKHLSLSFAHKSVNVFLEELKIIIIIIKKVIHKLFRSAKFSEICHFLHQNNSPLGQA